MNHANKVCFPSKKEDLNIHVPNMTTGKNESKPLTKHVLCKCECKHDGRNCNLNHKWNNKKCRRDCKKHHICEKIVLVIVLYVIVKMANIQQVFLTFQWLLEMEL